MLSLLRRRSYRIILTANFISLFGSGLNHASIIWFILEQTHSEKAVALLISVITLPSLVFLPFSGVLIDRLDRRYTTIALDLVRGAAVAAVTALAFAGQARVWHIYAMGVVLGLGAFMFWPNMGALTQELVEAKDVVAVNALVMSGAQGGWMIAGAVVGFLYQRFGLGGVLALDAASYALSAWLMYRLRRGRHVVHHDGAPFSLGSFNRDFVAGLRYTTGHRRVLIFGSVAALFTAAMMSQNVLTAPLNQKILGSGATGFGFCNAGWSFGAILASGYAGSAWRHGRKSLRAMWISLVLAGLACVALPYSLVLAAAVAFYFVMGVGRALAGVGVGSALMREVPRNLMGRTQNVFTFAGIAFQLGLTVAVGWLSERFSLVTGFYVVGFAYLAAGLLAYTVARGEALEVGEEERLEPVVAHIEPAEL